MPSALIADLLAQGVHIDAAEAVAIAQQLIVQLTSTVDATSQQDEPLLGPPTPANVLLGHDGSVICLGCHVKPAVFEMAVLLQTLLPTGTAQVPGGLRYAIARGVHDVDAPPFDSIEEFSQTLSRFERNDRATVVRGILARAVGQTPVHEFGRPRLAAAAVTERRRTAPAAAVLRRQLHEADRRLFEEQAAARGRVAEVPAAVLAPVATRVPVAVPADQPKQGRWYLPAVAAVFFGGVALAGVADLMHLRQSRQAPQVAVAGKAAPAAGAVSDGRSTPGSIGSITAPAASPQSAQTPLAPPVGHQAAVQDSTREARGSADASTLPVAESTAPRYETASKRGDTAAADPSAVRKVAATEVAGSDGTLVRALDAQHRPVFSPAFASSGTAMFFHTGGSRDAHSALAVASSPESGSDLGVMTIVDDGARNYHVQPSPDGRSIAFDSDRDGERGVYIARRDGSNVRRISGPGYAAVPTWAPDGRRITYVRAERDNPKVWNLWMQSLEDSEPRKLTNYQYGQPWSASWFPDNRRVSYTHEDKVVILDVETGRSRQFSSPIKGRLVRTPAVSPDGTKVIFQVYRQGAWILDVASGAMNCVLTDPTAEEFAWAPDGQRVAFHSRRDGQWGIYILHQG